MTTPAWAPPDLPRVTTTEEPEQSRRGLIIMAILLGVVVAFGAGAFAWTKRPMPAVVGGQEAVDVVDQLIVDMAANDWMLAYEAFDPECVEFDAESLQAGFEPVLDTYRSHELGSLRAAAFTTGDIVLVRGELDLGNADTNPIRAELVYAGTADDPKWNLCGLRIDEP